MGLFVKCYLPSLLFQLFTDALEEGKLNLQRDKFHSSLFQAKQNCLLSHEWLIRLQNCLQSWM